jgi:aminoglycoside 6'-N-acetyltransferase
LSTERLVLRRFRPDDAPVFASYRSDPEVARYQSWDAPVSVVDAAALVDEFARGDPESPGWFQYAVQTRSPPVLIGDIGVHLHENRMQAEIGFTFATAHQGRGYATEAVRAVLEHLFTHRGVRRVSAECDPRNVRSARLLERIGFRREGHRRANTWIKGEWTDDLLFGLLAEDWQRPARQPPDAGRAQ